MYRGYRYIVICKFNDSKGLYNAATWNRIKIVLAIYSLCVAERIQILLAVWGFQQQKKKEREKLNRV